MTAYDMVDPGPKLVYQEAVRLSHFRQRNLQAGDDGVVIATLWKKGEVRTVNSPFV